MTCLFDNYFAIPLTAHTYCKTIEMAFSLDAAYWQERWQQGATGWDIGQVAPPLQQFFDQLPQSSLRILVPGAGSGYEAQYLWDKGFRQLVVLDIAPAAIEAFRQRMPQFPESQIVCGNFFDHRGEYDLIVEHTFFCALHPSLRSAYAEQMFNLLAPGGLLAGLLFDDPMTDQPGPPFGGRRDEYLQLFSPRFQILTLERTEHSIAPRLGRELFVLLKKPNR
ncbi:MAG: methyltransferase [Chitinophagales bacterium]|nr:TPMT family class I SAM-dependent methyltransferase [Chitinophagales bacterium]MDW8393720.1 methyltransferase [Chitinophagales bacterium]